VLVMIGLVVLIISGCLIVLGSMIASAVAEALQYHYSDTLVACLIALLQTLPEYVFVVILTLSGHVDLALASSIGANILLLGLGFPSVIFIAYAAGVKDITKDRSLDLMRENSVESIFLAISGIYMAFIGVRGYMTLCDAIVLLALFIVYMSIVTRLPPEVEFEEPHGLARGFMGRKKLSAIAIVLSVLLVWYPAEIFTEHLLSFAEKYVLSEILLVALVAPIVSELPEKLTAYIGATKSEDMARLGICNFMSSKINNGTLLFSSMYFAWMLSNGGEPIDVPMGTMSTLLILAGVLTLVAAFTTIDRRITVYEGFMLLAIYVAMMLVLWTESLVLIHVTEILLVIISLIILAGAIRDRRFYWFGDFAYTISSIRRTSEA